MVSSVNVMRPQLCAALSVISTFTVREGGGATTYLAFQKILKFALVLSQHRILEFNTILGKVLIIEPSLATGYHIRLVRWNASDSQGQRSRKIGVVLCVGGNIYILQRWPACLTACLKAVKLLTE